MVQFSQIGPFMGLIHWHVQSCNYACMIMLISLVYFSLLAKLSAKTVKIGPLKFSQYTVCTSTCTYKKYQYLPYVFLISALIKLESTSSLFSIPWSCSEIVLLISSLMKLVRSSMLLSWQLHALQDLPPWAEVSGERTRRMVNEKRMESIVLMDIHFRIELNQCY